MVTATLAYLAADLGSKEWAAANLADARPQAVAACSFDAQGRQIYDRLPRPPMQAVSGVLLFDYAENCGAAFSLMRDQPSWLRNSVFITASVAAVLALVFMFVIGRGGTLFGWAVPLILSGALGNLIDRLRHGYVVDFIRIHPSLFHYPTFNVADIAIVVGVALLILGQIIDDRAARRSAAHSEAAS